MQKFFCSKDCPDCCPFSVDEKGNFFYINKIKGFKNFLCIKLKKFYEREVLTDNYSFIKIDNKTVKKEFEEACKITAYFLKENADKNILYLRGSGSLGYYMSYYDLIFQQFENCYFVEGSLCDETGITAHIEDFGNITNPDIKNLELVDNIILFGKNCKVTSPHLYAYLKGLKKKGKKIIYIDPIKSETVKLADKFIRINPATDGILVANIINILQNKKVDNDFEKITNVKTEDLFYLADIFKKGKTGIITGMGLQRYSNGKNIINWINYLAVITDNLDYLYFGRSSKESFEKPTVLPKKKIKIYEISKFLEKDFFDIIVIVAGNPLVTHPTSNLWYKALKSSKVIVIDTNFTETSRFADFFIKVGGMFAQPDAMGSYFFNFDNIREKPIAKLNNDINVIRSLSKHLNINFEIPEIRNIPLTKKSLKRVYKKSSPPKLEKPYIETNKFRLITCSNYFYLNSQLAENYQKEDVCYISISDSQNLDINDGDEIVLQNELGKVKTKAKISDKVSSGYIMMYKNRYYDNQPLNLLTKSIPTDSDNAVAIYDTFVEVKKAYEKI